MKTRVQYLLLAFVLLLSATAYAIPGQQLTIQPKKVNIMQGKSFMLKVKKGQGHLDNNLVMWTTNDESFATVDETGKLIALLPGQTQIIAVYEGDTAYAEVNVKENKWAGKLSIAPKKATIREGTSFQLYAVLGREKIDSGLVWSISDEGIANISDTGLLTAATIGTAVVSAVFNSDTATCEIKVVEIHEHDSTCSRMLVMEIGEVKTLLGTRDNMPNGFTIEAEGESIELEVDKHFNVKAVSVGEALVKILKDGEIKWSVNILVVDQGTKRAVADSIRSNSDGTVHIRFSGKIKKKGNGSFKDSIKVEVVNDDNGDLKSAHVNELSLTNATIDKDGQTINIELNRKLATNEVAILSLSGGLTDEGGTDVNFVLSVTSDGSATAFFSPNMAVVKLYPNPVSKMQSLNIQSDMEITQVKIYNMAGAMVFQQNIGSIQGKINTNQLNKGMYSLKAITETNEVSIHKLLVR